MRDEPLSFSVFGSLGARALRRRLCSIRAPLECAGSCRSRRPPVVPPPRPGARLRRLSFLAGGQRCGSVRRWRWWWRWARRSGRALPLVLLSNPLFIPNNPSELPAIFLLRVRSVPQHSWSCLATINRVKKRKRLRRLSKMQHAPWSTRSLTVGAVVRHTTAFAFSWIAHHAR